jgi:arylsulfatase A-like enzyme
MAMPAVPTPSPVARALWAGAIAGAVIGAGDALSAWGRLGQFVPGAGGRVRAALYTAGLCAAAAALGAALTAVLVLAFARWTPLGRLVAHGRARHAAARADDPRRALTGLALALAGIPALAIALYLAYRFGLRTLEVRHHKALIIAVTVGATLGLLVCAALATFAVGALLELLLRLSGPRAARTLSHPLAPFVGAAVLVACGVGVAAALAWRTVVQLPLRPIVVGIAIAGAVPAAWPLAGRALVRLAGARRRLVRDLAHPALMALALVVVFVAGAHPGVRKAAAAHTGLAAPIVRAIQWVADLDRDGYSPLLGGGDCDDLDGDVHPGAFDTPDDGIDQNCSGSDLKLGRGAIDTRFVALPAGVPADANILLVTIDTLRADHVGAYGYPRATTPAIDALAAEGSLFEHAFAHAPSTRYSMPAILTGRHPSRVLWDTSVWWPALRPENRTIAEILEDRGFTTGALLNYSYFDPVRRMNQGFHVYRNDNARLHQGRDPASTRGSSSREQADAAIAFLDEHAARRWFLWVHFYDPHFEYERHPGTTGFGESKIDLYDHEIRFTDDHVARVLARVRELGLWDRTVVVVTGDHGEGFGERGIDFHGYHLYAAQTRVPLVVRVPGLAPRKIAMPVGHVDLVPTLANLAGAPSEPAMEGRSLVAEMAGLSPADQDRAVFQEVSFEGPTERRGVVTRRWHLLYNMVPDNSWELYDRVADAGEARDVWGSHDVDALVAELRAWIDVSQLPPDAADRLERALLPGPPSPQHPLDVDLGGAIRLVGYDLSANPARAGGELDVTWYFRCDAPLEGPWGVFVHVENVAGPGTGRFTGDHDPVGGVLPFSRWKPGQLIADEHTMRLPANARPGEYAIWMGLWHRKNQRRAPARGAGVTIVEDRVRVGTIAVTR